MKEVNQADLAAMQKLHIEFLESHYNKIAFCGVPIIRCLTYKIIQPLNNVGLKAYLGEEDNGQDSDLDQ